MLRGLKIFCFFCLAFIIACQTHKQYTSKPTKSVVNPDSDLLEVNAVAYHLNDSSTSVFLEIINENLIYRRPDTTNSFYSELIVSYKLLPEANSKKIIDSSSFKILDRAGEQVFVKSLKSKFNVKALTAWNYYLDIQVLDINKRTKYNKGINIYKVNKSSGQNYLVTKNNDVVFRNSFLKKEVVQVETRNQSVSQLTVDCFTREFPIALPPFSIKEPDNLKYKPDSSFTINISGNSFSLVMPEHGFYHVRSGASFNEGLTLLTFEESFPGVSDSEEMIDCTRYLMNKSEYDECKNSQGKKECIDNFWIDIGGSNERAKELLKRYYGRVKEANKYYTSYIQGWKTDRGMIFVVFGPPTNTYRSSKDEVWIYGSETNPNSLRFVFYKTTNPFSDNDYILERSQFFKEAWYNAVDYWRQGHVYLEHTK